MVNKVIRVIYYFMGVMFILSTYLYSHKGWGVSEKNIDNKPSYKVVKQKINLLPLKPLSVLGLNSFLIKDNKGETYLALIFAEIKNYTWHIDTVKVPKKFVTDKENNLNEDFPINVYLDETVDIYVRVKKLNGVNYNKYTLIEADNINYVDLPYFIAINDEVKNKIIILKQGTIDVNLNSKTNKIRENIKIMFNQKNLNKIELVLGFKQTSESFNNLISYINNYNKNHVELLDKYERKI